jgi:hypothetical protein
LIVVHIEHRQRSAQARGVNAARRQRGAAPRPREETRRNPRSREDCASIFLAKPQSSPDFHLNHRLPSSSLQLVMSRLRLRLPAFTLPLLSLACAASVQAAGVMVGNSTLIGQLDYSDTFTGTDSGGRANRPYIAAIQPPAAYVVENTYGNPSISFQGASFSFASDGPGLVNGSPAYPGSSGAGSATGITQTGGGVDYGLAYGLRSSYIVQVDAVQVADRIDISTGSAVGIGAANSLSVFFRGDGSGNASLYNGVTDTPIRNFLPAFNTGITGAGQWNNYAVRYDTINKEIEIFVNQVSRGVINLNTFALGIYANFSNAVVGAGAGLGAGENRTWTDNFQVGSAIPEPGVSMMALLPLAGLLLRRRRAQG